MTPRTAVELTAARDALVTELRAAYGVGSVGIGWTSDGERCLEVGVPLEFPTRERIPTSFHGLPVVVRTLGPARFQAGRV